jgi:hypothetical protein
MKAFAHLSWKQIISRLDALHADSAKRLWETAQLVRHLYRDRAFVQEACDGKPAKAESWLAKYCGTILVSDLVNMIEHFPSFDDWKDGRADLLMIRTAQAIGAEAHKRRQLAAKAGEVSRHSKVSVLSPKEQPSPASRDDRPHGPTMSFEEVAKLTMDREAQGCQSCNELRAEVRRLEIMVAERDEEIAKLKAQLGVRTNVSRRLQTA